MTDQMLSARSLSRQITVRTNKKLQIFLWDETFWYLLQELQVKNTAKTRPVRELWESVSPQQLAVSWRGHNQRVKWQYNNSISNKTLWCHQVLIKYRPLQVTYLAYWGVSWWWGETKQSRAVAPPWAGEECAEVRWLLISNYKYLHFLPLSLLVCSLLSSKTDLNYSITRAFNI